MKIAIIGAGNVGTAVATAATAAGHDVTVSADSAEQLQAIGTALPVTTAASNAEAVASSDVVVLAVPFAAAESVTSEVRDQLAGKVLIDATNPLAGDLSGVTTVDTSGAELVQRAAPDARVVKAFNTVFAGNQANPVVDGTQLDGFVAGDDDDAKQVVSAFLEQIGYRPIDVGPLSFARYLEGMAFLNIALNANNGWSWTSGWKLVGHLS